MSAVDQTNISHALTNNYIDKQVIIRRGVLDAGYNVIPDPIIYADLRLNNFEITEDINSGSSTLEWFCSNHWSDFESKNGRISNSESQQKHFPNDLGFEFIGQSINDIKWGRA